MPVIDVHAHAAIPEADAMLARFPEFLEQLREDSATLGPTSSDYNRRQIASLAPSLTDPALRIQAMDAAGVDVQAVSATPIPRHWLDEQTAAAFTRAINDGLAAHCSYAPGRLGLIASVALHHPAGAVAELTRAVEELGAIGVQISTSAGRGRELDDPEFDLFWARVVDLDLPVLIHPWGCTLGERLDIGYMFNHVGNPTETSVALSRLIFGGVLDRFPALRIWGAHGGGWLPSYSGRADHAWEQREDARTCLRRPSDYLREMWVDSLVYTPEALRHLLTAMGSTHVTIGTDYPFDMGVVNPLERLAEAGLSADEVDEVGSRSALALFGRRFASLSDAKAGGARA
ncbi:MAG: Aminocarboxymuconate-semialdehyde decarboxylase [Microbacteriaceae bacterium]|jgi:predicted TIM-barrel fold metal-dependent hydrolase|nr:Aminocarboxymuconate-semialdehyde decarboxylase [Microbacteriaceae bacterium]